jgi:hypothetical protein
MVFIACSKAEKLTCNGNKRQVTHTKVYVHIGELDSNPALSSLKFNVLEVKVSDATNTFGTSIPSKC